MRDAQHDQCHVLGRQAAAKHPLIDAPLADIGQPHEKLALLLARFILDLGAYATPANVAHGQEKAEVTLVAIEVLQMESDHRSHDVQGTARLLQGLIEAQREAPVRSMDHGLVDRTLAVEQSVQGRDRQTRSFGDLVDGRVLVGDFAEQILGHVQYGLDALPRIAVSAHRSSCSTGPGPAHAPTMGADCDCCKVERGVRSARPSTRAGRKPNAMAERFELTEEMRAAIGHESIPWTFEVTTTSVRAFARGVGYTDPVYYDEVAASNAGYRGLPAPPTYLGTPVFVPGRSHDIFSSPVEGQPSVKHGLKNILDGGTGTEYREDICAGDRLTAVLRVADLTVRESKALGKMLIVTTQQTYTNQHGKVAAIQRSQVIFF